MKFTIDPEISSLLPRLSDEERNGLRLLIETDGHVDPAVIGRIGKDRILLDGHNRHEICTELKIKLPVREIVFATRDLAIAWVIDNQLGRRNLTDERRDYYQGKKRLNTKGPPGNPQLRQNDTIEHPTREDLAEEFGVSPRTVERNAEFAEAVDAIAAIEGPAAKEEILNGTSGKTKKEVIESAPVLCDRCKRVGQARDCPRCAELRAEKKAKKTTKKKEEKKPAVGAVLFDWQAFYNQFGAVARAPDKIAAAYDGEKESADFKAAHRHLDDFLKVMKSWQKRLQKVRADA